MSKKSNVYKELLEASQRMYSIIETDEVIRLAQNTAVSLTGAKKALCRIVFEERMAGYKYGKTEALLISRLIKRRKMLEYANAAGKKISRIYPIINKNDIFIGFLKIEFAGGNCKKSCDEIVKNLCRSVAISVDNINLLGEFERAVQELDSLSVELKGSFERVSKLDRVKDSFLSLVSHELRTPMTVIKGTLALMKNKLYDTKNADLMELHRMATSNSDRMVRLLEDVLDVSRIHNMNFSMSKEKIELNAVVDTLISDMKVIVEKKGIRLLKEKTNGQKYTLYADPFRISQAVSNLINNAAKFSPENSAVTVSLARGEGRAAGEVVLKIADEGMGIDEKNREKIFDQFFQIENPDTRKYGGLGLGLFITRKIIEEHGGSVVSEANGAKGACFVIRLPLNEC